MAHKIVVVKAGFGAGTVTDPNNMTFSSDYNTLKYATSGSITITYPGSISQTIVYGTVTHSLGYYPICFVYTDTGNSYWDPARRHFMMPYRFADAGFWVYEDFYIGTGILKIKIDVGNAWGYDTGAGTINYYYKIFKNNLNL